MISALRTLSLAIGLATCLATPPSHAQSASGAELPPADTPADDEHAQPQEDVIAQMLKPSHGQSEAFIRDALQHCDGTNTQMKICASYRWTKQDMRLNRLYAEARRTANAFGNAYEPALVKAQLAWLAWRDAQCALEGAAQAGGGTLEGLYVLSCMETLTKEQADRLEAISR